MVSILITGGTSGIGLATAALLHDRDWTVAVTGSRTESVESARTMLPDDVLLEKADSASLADTDRLVAVLAERFGELDALFLNAGLTRSMPLADVDEATYDQLFATNTKGAFFTLQRCLPLLRDGASIVITVGVGTARGIPGGAVSSGSRGALLAMIPSLAADLAPRRIRVNAVSPGAIDTPIWSHRDADPEAVERTKESLAASIPFGRLGAARDIAEAVAYLVSDAASYVTGQNLSVAGGL